MVKWSLSRVQILSVSAQGSPLLVKTPFPVRVVHCSFDDHEKRKLKYEVLRTDSDQEGTFMKTMVGQ